MNGRVDLQGRALLDVQLSTHKPTGFLTVSVWIDTGFTGELVLPNGLIEEFRLEQSGTTLAVLADGSTVPLRIYSAWIQWFGVLRKLEVVGNDGEYPLLGVGLLTDHDLQISYRSKQVTLD
jgi:clan AA aspartic protease